MIFYVYMSPGVIEEASEGGSYAVDSLIGILQGFLQNCFIAEFEDGRVMSAVNRHISRLPALDTRKKIGKLFELLKKRRHLICCLVTDYLSECDDLSCVIKQADKALLDFILIAKKEMPCHLSLPPEVKTLSNYNQSDFEAYRSALACYGRTLKPDELAQDYLLNNPHARGGHNEG